MSDTSTITVTVEREGHKPIAMTFEPSEFRSVVADPIYATVDDGDWSWSMQEHKPDRFGAIAEWSMRLDRLTRGK